MRERPAGLEVIKLEFFVEINAKMPMINNIFSDNNKNINVRM
jgi:hypothetical protein